MELYPRAFIQGVTYHTGSQVAYLLPDTSEHTRLNLNSSQTAGARVDLPVPEGWEAELS